MIKNYINALINVFVIKKIIKPEDKIYYKNIISGYLNINNNNNNIHKENDIAILFDKIGDYAFDKLNIKKEVAINFISSLMISKPSEINTHFWHIYKINKKDAIKYFYDYSINSYYIKYDKLSKNIKWNSKTKYGILDIMINLSKPEKTIQEIEEASKEKDYSKYPKCALCYENIGFFGSAKKNSRQNIRFVNLKLNDQKMFMHYSPYGYYKEHLIVNKLNHEPIIINKKTLIEMIDFVDLFPFYFIGSNADLPIVGGSIMSHAHFQGGAGIFPIFQALVIKTILRNNIKIEILDWPLSSIKLISNDKNKILEIANKILIKWRNWSDHKLNILSKTGTKIHNTISPIIKKQNNEYIVYLILRNNKRSKKYPNGIFHLHSEIWNIKSENIGIIEAMGQAILPQRLKNELKIIKKYMNENKKILPSNLSHHQLWFEFISKKWNGKNIDSFIKNEIANHFAKGLENCGVFKNYDAFILFLESVLQWN